MRIRAAAILIQNRALALLERHRQGSHYFSFPGGGVDEGESPEQAVVREVLEELGVHVRVLRRVALFWFRGNPQHFFLVEQIGGTFGAGTGKEFSADRNPARGSYAPIWMPIDELAKHNVLPKPVAELIVRSYPDRWPAEPVTFSDEEPSTSP